VEEREEAVTETTPRPEDVPPAPDKELFCPISQQPASRLIRGKIDCGNCGFIES